MKMSEVLELSERFYEATEELRTAAHDDLEIAKKLYRFVMQVSIYEAGRGANASDVEREMFMNDMWFDGVDQIQYFENIMGEPAPEFANKHITLAAQMWLQNEVKFTLREIVENLEVEDVNISLLKGIVGNEPILN